MLDLFLSICDPVLGWLLLLPTTIVVIIVAALSSLAMVVVRKWMTDQAYLARCAADKKRLKQLKREARKRKDKSAVQRIVATTNRIQLRVLKAEGWPLLAGLIPIAVLGTWSYYRLAYIPPAPQETVAVELSLPASSVGSLVTMVPQDGLTSDHWITRVETGEGPIAHGVARWHIAGPAADQPYVLQMRYRDRTFDHPLLIGQRVYSQPVHLHEPGAMLPQSIAKLRPVTIFGVIPWFAPTTMVGTFMPAWLVMYIAVVLPMVYVFKAVFRIH